MRMRNGLIAGLLVMVSIAAGCLAMGNSVTGNLSQDIDRIPTTIGVYPLLSVPVAPGHPRFGSLDVRAEQDGVYIVPPSESRLVVTAESQILTGFISSELLSLGFDLKEVPVEAADGDLSPGRGGVFVITLELLRSLRAEYGLEAILIGNAIFGRCPSDPSERCVNAAYLKVVDVESLDVLAQVTLSYDKIGSDINVAAREMALALAMMAELVEEGDV